MGRDLGYRPSFRSCNPRVYVRHLLPSCCVLIATSAIAPSVLFLQQAEIDDLTTASAACLRVLVDLSLFVVVYNRLNNTNSLDMRAIQFLFGFYLFIYFWKVSATFERRDCLSLLAVFRSAVEAFVNLAVCCQCSFSLLLFLFVSVCGRGFIPIMRISYIFNEKRWHLLFLSNKKKRKELTQSNL